MEKNKSLKKIEIWGLPAPQVNVELNIEKIAQSNIPVNQILQAMQSENLNIPGGSINIASKKFNVKTSGKYKTIDDIKNTIVAGSGTKIIYLKDVANVSYAYKDETHLTRYNSHRAIFITACMKDGQNIVKVAEQVTPTLDGFKKELPKNMVLSTVFDQSSSVSERLSHFGRDFAIAILLVLITLLPLGFRAATVVMISIPFSLAIGLILLNLFGYTINQLSIVGLIVALGILVDDSIVVVENIERFLRDGYSKRNASIEAVKQIGLAVMGCTATLIFAFLPIVFLPEGSGEFIRSLPLAVILTVLASLFVSLTIVPFLSSRILSAHENPEGNIFLRVLKRGIHASYAVFLDRALKHPVITLLFAGAIFGGTLMLVPHVGFSLFPHSEKPMFVITVETPEGTNLAATDAILKSIEAELKKEPRITSTASNVGKGNPRIYYNVIQHSESESYSELFVQCKGLNQPEKEALIDDLRDKFATRLNAKIEVKDFEQGPPVDAPISMRIFGENLDTLRALSFQVEDIIKKTPGTIYVNNPLATQGTGLKVKLNKEKAGMLGIPTAEANKMIRLAIAGLNVGTFRDDKGDEFEMNVMLPRGDRVQTFDVFKRLYVNNVLGTAIPLTQVADIQFDASPNTIHHFDKNRYATVSANVRGGALTSKVTDEIIAKLDKFPFPPGYSYVAAGEVESRQESFGGLGTIILITLFGFVGVLILEFKTFKSTLIVLSVIPLGIIGAILMLLFTGYTFSFTATIGVIALVGIEVKNSILLVDFTNQLREQGKSLEDAIREAGETRFVPIVLTSLTAIGGLIPLAIEGNPLYSPLALVLIGGLISSTLLSRLVTPVMYKLLPPKVGHDD